MPVERESNIERRWCERARRHGFLTYKFVSPQRRGVPDQLVICPGGHVVFIEFKRPSGKLTPLQTAQIRKLLDQGCEVHVVYSHDQGDQLFDRLKRQHPQQEQQGDDDIQ
jgi:hypothetical protein